MTRWIKPRARREHEFGQENLSAYLDGELTLKEKERLERHLATCAICQQDLTSLRQTVNLLRRLPARPVPRSFVLPPSVQPMQASFARLNATYLFMRTAAVAVSFMLILLLGGDVLLSRGVVRIPDVTARSSAPAAQAYGEQPAAQALRAPAPESVPDVENQGEAEAAQVAPESTPTEEAFAAARARVAETPTAEPPAPEATAAAAATPAENNVPETAGLQPAPTESAGGPSEAPKGMGGGAEPTATPTPAAAQEAAPAEAATEAGIAAAQEAPAETPAALAAKRGPEQPAPEDTAQALAAPAPAPTPAPLSPFWALWRTIRLLALALAGVLLVLLAGVLWLGQRRQL